MAEQTTVEPKPKRKGRWSDPEWVRKYNREWRRKRAKAGKKAKPRKAKKKRGPTEDAIIYLRHAVAKMDHGQESWSDLLTKLALKTLEGEGK